MPQSYAQTPRLSCPQCRESFNPEVWLIVDVSERPDLLECIRWGVIHTVSCSRCGAEIHVDAPLCVFRPAAEPHVVFSPAPQFDEEQNARVAHSLIQHLRDALTGRWQESWLAQGLPTVARDSLPAFLVDSPSLPAPGEDSAGACLPEDLRAILQRIDRLVRPNEMVERIELCEQALSRIARQVHPVLWAGLQRELAKSLSQDPCGDQGENIERAIRHHQQALEVFTRQDYPAEWATTQNNLASDYRRRVRGDRAENIELAIDACQQALEVRTRQADPEGWATTHNNLANAYRDRVRDGQAENIEQAIHHCRLALEVFSPQAHPWKWATAQNNLANVYQDRIYGDQVRNHELAIEHYQQALAVFTCQTYPQDWAWTHCNLGAAYHARLRGERSGNLEQAIHHSQQSLTVYTRQADPREWALTHLNLANIFRDRVYGEHATNLEQASAHYRLALEVFTAQAYPERWTVIQDQLVRLSREQAERAPSSEVRPPTHSPSIKYPAFYLGESQLQPGAKRRLRLVHAGLATSKYESPIRLAYEWDELLSEEGANQLLQLVVAFVSCAIFDAATAAGLDCRVSAIPNGRRPAWLLADERVPISLTLSDIVVEERVCIMHIAPVAVALSQLTLPGAHWRRLLASFETWFATIRV